MKPCSYLISIHGCQLQYFRSVSYILFYGQIKHICGEYWWVVIDILKCYFNL